MSITDIKDKRKGRPTIKEIPLPPHVQRALTLRGNGSWWKDAAESWFYTHIKKRGNNWYIKNDRSNLKDIEIWEVSTNKKLGTIKFQNDKNLSEQSINQMKRLLKKAAQGYKA